jgi:hypothetical protein
MLYTVFAFIAILIQDFFYNLFSGTLVAGTEQDKNWTLLAFIVVSTIIIGTYRVFKGATSGSKVNVS